jgi:hypothetical protein
MLKMLSELCVCARGYQLFFASIIYFLQLGVRHQLKHTAERFFHAAPDARRNNQSQKLDEGQAFLLESNKTNDNNLSGSTRIKKLQRPLLRLKVARHRHPAMSILVQDCGWDNYACIENKKQFWITTRELRVRGDNH